MSPQSFVSGSETCYCCTYLVTSLQTVFLHYHMSQPIAPSRSGTVRDTPYTSPTKTTLVQNLANQNSPAHSHITENIMQMTIHQNKSDSFYYYRVIKQYGFVVVVFGYIDIVFAHVYGSDIHHNSKAFVFAHIVGYQFMCRVTQGKYEHLIMR